VDTGSRCRWEVDSRSVLTAESHDRGCWPGTISFPVSICILISSITCPLLDATILLTLVVILLCVGRERCSPGRKLSPVTLKIFLRASHKRTSVRLFSAKTALTAKKTVRLA